MTQTLPFRVVVHGGGPVGCLAAMLLRAHTDDVIVVEKRADMRAPDAAAAALHGRSINLVLTSRGLYALQQVGMKDEVLQITVPVTGRLVHTSAPDAATAAPPVMQRYGVHAHEVNYSVSRNALNKLLLDAAEARGVRILFEHELVDVDYTTMTATYRVPSSRCGDGDATTTQQLRGDFFVGADGVHSVTRRCMLAHCRATTTAARDKPDDLAEAPTEVLEPLGVSYKELRFPPRRADEAYPRPPDDTSATATTADARHTKDTGNDDDNNKAMVYSMDCHGLHIWPHGAHFLMALPDIGNTFTGTMYLPNRTAPLPSSSSPSSTAAAAAGADEAWRTLPTFDELDRDAAALQRHVATYYAELPRYVPDWAAQLQRHRASALYTLHCPTWHCAHKVVLLGDAAHAVTPFFGQGMNLGFESAMLLDRFVRRSGALTPPPQQQQQGEQVQRNKSDDDDEAARTWRAQRLATALAAYEAYHHPSADAIARMAKDNYVDMAQRSAQAEWRQLRALEKWVEARYGSVYRSRYYLVTQTLTPYRVAELAGPVLEACLRALLHVYTTRAVQHRHDAACGDCAAEAPPSFDEVLTHEDVCAAIATHVTPFAHAHQLRFDEPAYDGFYPSSTATAGV